MCLCVFIYNSHRFVVNMKNGISCLFETKVDFCAAVRKGISVEVDFTLLIY